MQYKALKPCKFGGNQYRIGDVIPEGVIDEDRVKRVISIGLITPIGNSVAENPSSINDTITIALTAYEADIDFTKAEIVEAIGILQKTPTAAIESINALDVDSNVFKLVRSIETRSNVKKAITAMLEGEDTNDADEKDIEENGKEIED